MAGNAYKWQYNADEAINLLYQKGLMGDNNMGFLQTAIDDIEITSVSKFWQDNFTVDPSESDIDLSDTQKDPAWTIRSLTKRVVPMADAMSPLSETAQLDNEGWVQKTGNIYQFGKGLYQNSVGKLELEAKLKAMNIGDQNIILGFVKGVADLIKTHNYRLSNMAAMVLSKGGAYDNTTAGKGMSGVTVTQDSYIPAANFIKAGTKVWSASDCDIPSQMQKIEDDFKTAHSYDDVQFEWDIPYDLVMTVLLKNTYFIKEVSRYIALYAPDKVVVINNSSSSIETNVITWQQLVAYSRSDISKIAPIRVMKESQVVQDITTTTSVKGWKTGVAVLRPLGYAGVIVHAKPTDVKLFESGEANDGVQFNIAQAQGFLYVINKIVPNGQLKAYHTDVIGRYAPVLNEIMQHLVVDTTTADS